MSSRYKFHAYNQDEINSLQGIALPAKIKCGRCLKNLPQAKFSAKQLNDARSQIKASSKISKPIRCQSCTGQQVVEVECTMCGKTKGLEDFAKSQRRNPDTAKCFKCIEKQLAEEAIDEDKYEDPDKAFVTPNHSNGHYPKYFSSAPTDTCSANGEDDWTSVNANHNSKRREVKDGGIALSAEFQRVLSVGGSADDNLIDTEYAYPAGHDKNSADGWSEVEARSWHTQSVGGTSIISTSASNPNRRSGISGAGPHHTYTQSGTARSAAPEVRRNCWPKIPAAPRGPPIRPMGDAARETGPLVDAWEDSDDDEEGGDDDESDADEDTII